MRTSVAGSLKHFITNICYSLTHLCLIFVQWPFNIKIISVSSTSTIIKTVLKYKRQF